MDKKTEKILNTLWQLKYRNISVYDIDDSGISKYLIVATALNPIENKKLSTKFSSLMNVDVKMDGWHKGEWIIIDLEEVVIHLFSLGQREKYNIDKLYKGKQVKIDKNSPKKKKD